MADHDTKHASKDEYGNVTAKDQHGLDANGKPRKAAASDNWKFGDSLKGVTSDKKA